MAKKQLNTSGVDMSVFQKKSLNTEGVDMSVFDVKKKDSGDEVSKSSEEPITSVGSETTAQKFGSQQLFDKDGKIPQNSKLADKPKTEQESNFVPDTYFDEKISEGDSRYGVSIYNYSKSNIEKNDAVSKHNSIIENINSGSDSTYNAIIEDKKKQIQTEVEKLQKQFDFKEPTNDQEVDEYNKKVVDFNKQAKQIQEKILSTIDKDVEDYVNKTVPSVIEDKYIDKNDKAQLDTMIEKEMPVSYDDKKKYIDKIVESMTYFYDEKEKKEAKSELYNYLSEKLLFDKEGNPTQYALKNQAETRLEKVNKRISELENELSKPQFQRTRREITRGQFAGTRSYTPSSEETKLRDELSNLRQAQNKYREVIALPDKQEGVKVGKFSDAFTAETVADIATGGFASAFVALDVLGKIKKGEDATDAEKEMLNALSLNNAAKGDIKENMRTWAIVGQGVAGSLPFVTSIMLSGGTSALFRAGTKKALGWELKNTIKNRIINQVGNVTSAAARVPFYGGYYESLADRRAKIEMKYDPISGQFAADVKESEKPFIADATKQFVTTWTEFYAEELGGSIAARVVNPLAKRIGLKNITNSVFKKVTEATKINDPITEYLEEVVTGGMQIAIGEQDPKEFLTWKTQWETLLTTTVMSGTPQVLTAPFSKNTEGLAKHFNKKQIAEIEKILAIEDISEKAKQLTQFSYDNKIGEDAIRQLGDYAWKSQAEQADKITKEEAEKIKKDQTELATQQEQLDYLKEKGVEVPDGTSMENLNKLYNETKKSETPKVSERDTKLEFVKSRGIEIAEDISDNELDKTYREQRVSKIKEDNVEFDNQISESQKRLGLPTTPDIKISDDTELTLEQLDNGEPVTNEFLKKASDELYKKYNELEAMKQSDSRVYTTEQIESMQEFLGEEITKLENYAKEQAETGKFVGETETGEVTERGAEEVVEVKPKIKEDGKEMQEREGAQQGVQKPEDEVAERGKETAEASKKADEEAVVSKEPSLTKQTWEMTESEYDSYVEKNYKTWEELSSKEKAIAKRKYQEDTKDFDEQEKEWEKLVYDKNRDYMVVAINKSDIGTHKSEVMLAMEEGRNIPDDVKEKYPELFKPTTSPQKPSDRVSPEKGVTTPRREKVAETAPTQAETAKLEQGAGIKPKNVRDVYKAGREVFGLNRAQALAQAVVVDRIIGKIAKRRGVNKSKVYSEIEFRKSKLEDLSKESKNLYQAVWHGSPYEFDKFRLDKIGTGEGAQAFGWGLYFTDKKAIAEGYAESLGAEIADYAIDDVVIPKQATYEISNKQATTFGVDRLNAINKILSKYGIRDIEDEKELEYKINRNLYKVKLHGARSIDEFNYLRWDKPVSEKQFNAIIKQAEREGLKVVGDVNEGFTITGKMGTRLILSNRKWDGLPTYDALTDVFGSQKEASLFLLRAGIDGIKYPTESLSRGTHEESFNYVIFDENVAEIEEHIKFQKQKTGGTAKGAIQFLEDGNAIIHALTDPNVSTPLHEIAHLYEKYTTKPERDAVLKWAKTKTWTTETSEKFARGFERYLADGKAPVPSLQKVFDRFKAWLTDIYNGITGSEIDIELNDAMRGVYSAMLGEGVVKTKKRTAAETKPSTTGFDDVDALLFQDVLFQGEDKTEKHTKAVNLLVDKAESAKEDVEKFVREKLANAGNPVREEIITNVLKERGYAKEKQSGEMRSEGKQKQPKRKGDSDLSEGDRAELQDRKKDKKVSQFGKRFFTATSQVPEEVQDLIVEKGIHLYEPTSLEEAVTVATEMASNLSYEELKDIITSNRKMNEAVRANIAIQTLKKSTAEMRQNRKNGVNSPYLVNLQLEVLRSLKDNVSAAGLLMRATQGDEFTEYIAPDAWVQDYIDTVLGSRRTSMKEKWFNRASDLFDKKAKRAVSESVSETMDTPKVKKEIEKAKKRKSKAPKSEAVKKRNDIVAKWKKSLESRKTLFQAARSEFVWMEEDIQFARDVVQTYIEDGVYNRNVLAEKLSMQFESLGLPVEEEVLRRIIPDEFNGVPLDELFERQQLDKAAESLATRIFGSVIETKKKNDPLLQMVNTLLSKFKERTETKEVKKKTDLEKVVDAISRVSDYKEVWKEARDLAIDKVDANESLESIQKELAKEKINYAYDNATKFTFTENQIRGVVRDAIRKKEINLDDLVRSHMSVRGATRETLRNFIIDSSGLDAEGAKTLSDAVYGVYERMLTQRATNIVSKEAKKMGDKVSGKEVEKRIVATETERLLDMILLKAFENDEFRNAYASVKGIPRITEDHVANIEMLADKVRETPSTGVKRMRKDDLLMYMRRLEGVSIQEALDTLWFAAVLSGVPTQVRNAYGAFGNVYGDLFLKIASNPLKAADIIKSQSRGFRFGRTKAGVIWRTGKYFFENRTDAPMASEYAVDKDSSWTNPFKFAAYLMRFMSANDQLALSVGKEAYATLLANEQKNVNYFKKAFSKEYRRRINEEVERVLGLSKEQLDEFDRIVKEESEEYGYDINEQKIRKQELIDEARPLELVKDAETIAAELTGNTKAYGTIGYLIEQIAKPLRSFTVNIKVRGKDYAIHPTKLLAVFTKISTNVATTQLSFTPFGFMNVLAGKHGFLPKDNPFIREMSPAKKRIHIARATAGTVLIGLIWGLMNPDDEDHWFQLTANGTGNYKDEKELRRIGWRPYSVFIGGYDGIRVSYRYTPFALLMAPLGYMSDRKRFTKKGKEKSEFELVAWAMTDVFTYIADNTPLSGMLNFMNDIIGGIRGASDMAESGKDGAKAVAKAFLNIPKGIYGAGIVRSVIDTWDSFTRDERMENNKIYNDYIDRTVFEILPWEEDNFPARDSWGLPMKQYRTLDEFFGLRDEDQFASLREFHYEQGAGVVGMPNRNQLLFRVKFADGTQQYISLSRNNKNHRYLWNEVFLKKRGEYMRESMTSLKNTGYKNERYVEEFSKRKTKDQNNAKEDVYRYTLNKPLPVSEKNKE